MSYESDCNDYALFGNPERDHWDYEENARYDQFDGYDGFDYCGHQADMAPCLDCTEDSDCSACAEARAWVENNDRERAVARADYDNEVPF